ncbi:MAG: transglycosylase domain-containing protein [Pseudomonadota bacterium]
MKTSRAWLPWALGTAIGVPLLFAALCWAIYAWGARSVPRVLPATASRAPATIRTQYLAIETGGATRMPRLNPVTFWLEHFRSAKGGGVAPDMRLLHSATRLVQSRDTAARTQGQRHAAGIAYSIHIGRQWSFDQAVDTVLAESHFGRGSVGIETAAQAYFGVAASELRPQESLALIVLLRGPTWYDPDCRRERFVTRYAWAVERLGNAGPQWTPEAALSRMSARTCVR